MTDQDALPTLTATFPLWRWILIREGIEIVHTHQATSVMANESVVYASSFGLPVSVISAYLSSGLIVKIPNVCNLLSSQVLYTDHSLFQFDDLAGVILNRVSAVCGYLSSGLIVKIPNVCNTCFHPRSCKPP